MARFLLLAAFALLSVSAVVAVPASTTPVYTPPDGSSTAAAMCMISGTGLKFFAQDTTTAVTLNLVQANGAKGFVMNKFTYTCTVDSTFKGVVIQPTLMDAGSSAEVQFQSPNQPLKWFNDRDEVRNGVAYPTGISNNGKAVTAGLLKSPRTKSEWLPFVTGKNEISIGVGCNANANPNCYYWYKITCMKSPPSGGSVIGDPQFVGLRGQNYQIHGVAGNIYNIISDADLQYNSRFVFLNKGDCPVVHGRKQKQCFSHPGSYLGELGLKTRAGDRIHMVTGNAKHGFEAVTVNGKELEVGESVQLAEEMGSISRNSTHMAAVQVGNWDFVFENSDMFVNQRVHVINPAELQSHGLLGQTWREVTYPNSIKYIAGAVDDYTIRSKDIFGDDFLYNNHN